VPSVQDAIACGLLSVVAWTNLLPWHTQWSAGTRTWWEERPSFVVPACRCRPSSNISTPRDDRCVSRGLSVGDARAGDRPARI